MKRRIPLLAVGVACAAGVFAACGGSPSGAGAVPGTSDAGNSPVDTGGVLMSDGGEGADSAADAGTTVANVDASIDDAGADSALLDANGPPFACGSTLDCFEVSQFCGQVTGPHGGTFYDCNPVPAGCASDVSCACLATQGITSSCTEMDGGITVVAVE